MNPLLIKNYTAQAVVLPHRIVKFGAADGEVLHAAAASDLSVGVTDTLGAELGGRVDVVRIGIGNVEYGGTVARGAKLTSDSTGRAVAAAPSAGANAQIIGTAELSGVVGDIGKVLINPSIMQG
ncbi:DUF2190 domain-containing protein [Methylophaga sp.]|uniref:DUF2190 domain-containing protein n=1 Tax=Methylophaga sp. TaxID=2024840 RepID=UPI003A8DF4E2